MATLPIMPMSVRHSAQIGRDIKPRARFGVRAGGSCVPVDMVEPVRVRDT